MYYSFRSGCTNKRSTINLRLSLKYLENYFGFGEKLSIK